MFMVGRFRVVPVLVASCIAAALVPGCSAFKRFTGPEQRIFVSNYKDDTVSVLSGDPLREIKIIPVGDSPVGIAARRDPPLLAVANSTGGRITFIDPVSLEIVRHAEVEDIPEHVVFSPDGKLLFVNLPRMKYVAVIDPDAGVVRDKIATEGKPKRLAVSPDGRRLYILLHTKEGGVAVADVATRTVQTVVPTGGFPTDFALSRDGKRLVVASFNDDDVTVIDAESLKPIATWPVGTGFGVILHPTQPIAYSMESFDDSVRVINYETGAAIASIEPGQFPTYSAIAPDGRVLYVVNEDSQNVTLIDTQTNQRIDRVAVGNAPANAVVVGDR